MPKALRDPMPEVHVVYEEDAPVECFLFQYYPDELSFSADEFIGLTEDQAHQLFRDKDIAYLRGGPAGDVRF
jgi:hypothetical protein